MYISTNNCEEEEITFELYRLKKRFLLKDSLVLVASSTKTVSISNKLSNAVVASINTEDGSSSNYRFRVRLTKYLTSANQTTNVTLPPPTTNQTTNVTLTIYECKDGKDNDGDGKIDYPNDSDCIAYEDNSERYMPQCSDGFDNDRDGYFDYIKDLDCLSSEDNDESYTGGLPDFAMGRFRTVVWNSGLLTQILEVKNIGTRGYFGPSAPISESGNTRLYNSSSAICGLVTRNGAIYFSDPISSCGQFLGEMPAIQPGQTLDVRISGGFGDGKWCIDNVFLDSRNAITELNENNNKQLEPFCVTIPGGEVVSGGSSGSETKYMDNWIISGLARIYPGGGFAYISENTLGDCRVYKGETEGSCGGIVLLSQGRNYSISAGLGYDSDDYLIPNKNWYIKDVSLKLPLAGNTTIVKKTCNSYSCVSGIFTVPVTTNYIYESTAKLSS
jgi:hypothetical protein